MILRLMTISENTINNHLDVTESAIGHFSSLLKDKDSLNIRIGIRDSNLTFINPNVSAECGCGESFSI